MGVFYTYSVTSDFTNGVDTGQLMGEIKESTITIKITHIQRKGDVLKIHFVTDLSSPEQTTLNDLVANHTTISTTAIIPNIVSGTIDPTSTDDSGFYSLSTIWINSTSKDTFILVDNTINAAVWKQITNLKVKLDATTNPSSTDDSSSGYVVGSRWINVTSDKEYICLDSTVSAAIWKETVTLTSTQTLTNKTLTSPVISTISNSGTITLPTATDTLVGRATTDTFTNKTGTSNTNNFTARSLWADSGATLLSLYGATGPSSGQVLTSAGSGILNWQTPPGGISFGSIPYQVLSVTTDTSTTAKSYVIMSGMDVTPASGTWLVRFSASGNMSNTSATGEYCLYSGGAIVTYTNRLMGSGGGSHTNDFDIFLGTEMITTVNGSQSINVRYKTGNGTFIIHARSLILLKLS